MSGTLVIVRGYSDAEQQLLKEASEYAGHTDASFHVLRLISPQEHQSVESVEITSDIDRTDYEEPAKNQFEAEIADFIEEAVGDSFPYESHVKIADADSRTDTILDTADDLGCNHIFLVGKQRSPTGKAIFGDLTQKVILNFDGTITLTME
jgi:nucleotide-binding universal stress UspA family protein